LIYLIGYGFGLGCVYPYLVYPYFVYVIFPDCAAGRLIYLIGSAFGSGLGCTFGFGCGFGFFYFGFGSS
jgi:hypothetical protein